jgi:hypothetical protein
MAKRMAEDCKVCHCPTARKFLSRTSMISVLNIGLVITFFCNCQDLCIFGKQDNQTTLVLMRAAMVNDMYAVVYNRIALSICKI